MSSQGRNDLERVVFRAFSKGEPALLPEDITHYVLIARLFNFIEPDIFEHNIRLRGDH